MTWRKSYEEGGSPRRRKSRRIKRSNDLQKADDASSRWQIDTEIEGRMISGVTTLCRTTPHIFVTSMTTRLQLYGTY